MTTLCKTVTHDRMTYFFFGFVFEQHSALILKQDDCHNMTKLIKVFFFSSFGTCTNNWYQCIPVHPYLAIFLQCSYREQHGPVLLQAGGLDPGTLLLGISRAAERNLRRKSVFIQVLQTGEAGDRTPLRFWTRRAAVTDATTPESVRRQCQRPLQATHQSSVTIRLSARPRAVQLAELLDALVD